MVLPRVTPLPNYTPPDNVIVLYKSSGSFDESVIQSYLSSVVKSYMLQHSFEKCQLYIDHATCHTTQKVKETSTSLNIDTK